MRRALPILLAAATLTTAGCQPPGASSTSAAPAAEPLPFDWPPKLNARYPDLVLKNHRGEEVRLSDYKGRLILVEPIGMSCKACNAFVGGAARGGFGGVSPQGDLPPLDKLLGDYANGLSINDPAVLHVQLLLYDQQMQAPTVEEAAAWAKHFAVDKRPNHLVLVGDPRMIGPASHAMIPGFQLIDRRFVLRKDGAGHRPPHNIYTDLLPELGRQARLAP